MDSIDIVFGVTDFLEHGYEGRERQEKYLIDMVPNADIGHLILSNIAGATL